MEKILEEIRAERQHQRQLWGDGFDDKNTSNDWLAYITGYAAQGFRLNSSPTEFRKAMIKVATLAVAAVEAVDRNGGTAPRHYD